MMWFGRCGFPWRWTLTYHGVTLVKRKSTGLVKFYRSILDVFFWGGFLNSEKCGNQNNKFSNLLSNRFVLGSLTFQFMLFSNLTKTAEFIQPSCTPWKFNSLFAPEELLGPKRIVFLCYHFAGVNSLLNLRFVVFGIFYFILALPKLYHHSALQL